MIHDPESLSCLVLRVPSATGAGTEKSTLQEQPRAKSVFFLSSRPIQGVDDMSARKTTPMKAMKAIFNVLTDVTQEQRSRVQEALQTAIGDGSELAIEFAIKDKNRRILELEEERKGLRERLAKGERALATVQAGTRSRVKELLDQRQVLQDRLTALEMGAGVGSNGTSSDAAAQRSRIKELLDQRQVLQDRLTAMEMGAAVGSSGTSNDAATQDALARAQADAREQRALCQAAREELRAVSKWVSE